MDPASNLPLLTLGIFIIALLYSAVGHAGASGYIAVMTLFGLSAAVIKPTALVLNIIVASITTLQFARAGHFSWCTFWPFALFAMPLAFAGGYLNLPAHVFKLIVGVVLLASALRFFINPAEPDEVTPPSKPLAFAVGGGLGLLSGLTGTGGGIFLTPLMLIMRWAHTRTTAAVSALFILCNSISGLAGNFSSTRNLPSLALPLAVAVVVAGSLGSWLGSRKLPVQAIRRLLAVVLLIAGGKLILT
ncbi:MAG TPA: sulfite exporter TauE/SafE family protein [Nevskiaceae bacterium]|nr:sulfite exporter TauE/SafE family protein [Nevskiaceae bacterium]